jgi:hypothetical protein
MSENEIFKDEFIKKINKLPEVIVDLIKEYIPRKVIVFTNRENYNLYHSLIFNCIKNFDNFVRDMIRRDNEFIFNKVIRENFHKWCSIKKYRYKNMIFNNYFYFIINFCIENDSENCRKVISNFLKEHGLDKNLHKKNIIKYIKWKD